MSRPSLLPLAACAAAVLAVAFASVAGASRTAASRPSASGTIAFASERGGPLRIHVRTQGRATVVASRGQGIDVEPDWSPNGSRIAFATSDASGRDFDIAVIPAAGGTLRRVTSGPAFDEEPSWSPDGRWIAFASDRSGDFEIYAVRPDGTGLRQLTRNGCTDTQPDWSPDGKRIVFHSRLDGKPRIWMMDADGSHRHRVSAVPGSAPSWSPDGSTIAFQSEGPTNRIMLMDAKGGDVRTVTGGPGDQTAPAWSADGEWLAFVSDARGSLDVLKVHPDGSGRRAVTSDVWSDDTPAWRPAA